VLKLFNRAAMGCASRLRNVVYRRLGVEMREYCWLRAIEIPRNWSDIVLEGCALDRGVTLLCSGDIKRGKLRIGHGCYINRNTIFDAHESIQVGRSVMIGPGCFITDGNHSMTRSQSIKSQPITSSPVSIQDEAWLGAHVVVLPGVTIGRGAVIGAGSVVTKDVPEFAIAYGVPAAVKGHREHTNDR